MGRVERAQKNKRQAQSVPPPQTPRRALFRAATSACPSLLKPSAIRSSSTAPNVARKNGQGAPAGGSRGRVMTERRSGQRGATPPGARTATRKAAAAQTATQPRAHLSPLPACPSRTAAPAPPPPWRRPAPPPPLAQSRAALQVARRREAWREPLHGGQAGTRGRGGQAGVETAFLLHPRTHAPTRRAPPVRQARIGCSGQPQPRAPAAPGSRAGSLTREPKPDEHAGLGLQEGGQALQVLVGGERSSGRPPRVGSLRARNRGVRFGAGTAAGG